MFLPGAGLPAEVSSFSEEMDPVNTDADVRPVSPGSRIIHRSLLFSKNKVWERKLKQEKGAERCASIRPLATSPVICAMLAMASSVHPVEDKAGR